MTAKLRHPSVAKLRGQQPSVEENHGLLSKTPRKKWAWVFEWTSIISFTRQKLLPFFYTFKNSWRAGWKAVFGDQEQDKNLDSYVSCHLPVLILYRLFTVGSYLDDPSCCCSPKGRAFAEPHDARKEQQKPHKWQVQSLSGFTLHLLTLAGCFHILSLRRVEPKACHY